MTEDATMDEGNMMGIFRDHEFAAGVAGGGATLEEKRTATAHWAYTAFADVIEQVRSEDPSPRALSDRDRRQAAVRDMLVAGGIDLASDEQRDALMIFLTLLHQLCVDHEDVIAFTITTCELALREIADREAGRVDGSA